MQSTQQVESLNRIIKDKVSAKMILFNLGKSIQTKLECEVQHQWLSEYKNVLPTRELLTISTHEYLEEYLEDEYDTLQASLETIVNM
ncbi:33702_t:CDS:2, partial [Racocetra persica]